MNTSLLYVLALLAGWQGDPGEVYTIKRPALLAMSRTMRRELDKYQVAGDVQGIRQLDAQGHILHLQPGDTVKVIQVEDGIAELRVLTGREKGHSGFIKFAELSAVPRIMSAAEKLQRVRTELEAILAEHPNSPEALKVRRALNVINGR